MTIFSSYFARDYDDADIPLVAEAPVGSDEAEPLPALPPLRFWRIAAIVWYATFTGIFCGSIIALASYPPLPALWPPAWPESVLGSAIGLLLWVITLNVRRLARREKV
jgi:hypothetical protein